MFLSTWLMQTVQNMIIPSIYVFSSWWLEIGNRKTKLECFFILSDVVISPTTGPRSKHCTTITQSKRQWNWKGFSNQVNENVHLLGVTIGASFWRSQDSKVSKSHFMILWTNQQWTKILKLLGENQCWFFWYNTKSKMPFLNLQNHPSFTATP